ncbi:hypothetical protein NIES21_15230 [Anabaenopsis circularis NIES-21]|uniref:Uncharacterized protein n=1 Tax=Anabaenopsis circularis NIES-21 TaxID=1085406 RepID=A0A1Z4GDW3_9CYAN|nr:hypothetical protein NIES21_15230 [Anabaenopsis circularis NIES-21]
MSKFESRNQQAEDKLRQQSFFASLIKYLDANETKITRTVDRFISDIQIPTGKIPTYRTDHYLGSSNTPGNGAFQYSRYTAIIGGIRISAVDYASLMKIINVIK